MPDKGPTHKGDGKWRYKKKGRFGIKKWNNETTALSVDDSLDAQFGTPDQSSKDPFNKSWKRKNV